MHGGWPAEYRSILRQRAPSRPPLGLVTKSARAVSASNIAQAYLQDSETHLKLYVGNNAEAKDQLMALMSSGDADLTVEDSLSKTTLRHVFPRSCSALMHKHSMRDWLSFIRSAFNNVDLPARAYVYTRPASSDFT